MESEIFRAGVAPGSPTTGVEIKMLICYILAAVGDPMSFSQLYDALSEHNLVNYFELVRILEELADLGHLTVSAAQDGADLYAATALGREAASNLGEDIPASVREKALAASQKVMERHRRLAEVELEVSPQGSGFMLRMAIPGPEGALADLRMYAPTREECDLMKRRFLNAPLTVYKGLVALLTGDENVLGNIFTQEQPLF